MARPGLEMPIARGKVSLLTLQRDSVMAHGLKAIWDERFAGGGTYW